jgi:mitochondrial import receptor subunit TOM40
MGATALCASAETPEEATPAMPLEPPVAAPTSTFLEQLEEAGKRKVPKKKKAVNPGPYENAQDGTKSVVGVDSFDGFRFEINKPLSPKFAMSHSFLLGTTQIPSGYQYAFGANVAPTASSLLMGRVDLQKTVIARYHQQFYGGRALLKLGGQMPSDPESSPSHFSGDLLYMGDDFTASIKAQSGPVVALNYMQSLTDSLAVGGELLFHAPTKKRFYSGLVRYRRPEWEMCVSAQSMGLLIADYDRKISSRVRAGVEMTVNMNTRESEVKAGAQFVFKQGKFAATVDSSGVITTTLEERVTPALSFLFSSELDHSAESFRFGYGLQVG